MSEFEDLNEQLKQYIHEETMCEMSNFRKELQNFQLIFLYKLLRMRINNMLINYHV